jgi:hypothetical protein
MSGVHVTHTDMPLAGRSSSSTTCMYALVRVVGQLLNFLLH